MLPVPHARLSDVESVRSGLLKGGAGAVSGRDAVNRSVAASDRRSIEILVSTVTDGGRCLRTSYWQTVSQQNKAYFRSLQNQRTDLRPW